MATTEAATLCRTTLNFFDRGPTDVEVIDGRAADLPGWEVCGFELRRHSSAVRDWDDEDELARVHHGEMAALAQQLTGCDHALVIGHIKRNPEKAREHSDLAPITFVHSDFADSYGDVLRNRYRNPEDELRASLEAAGITPDDVAGARRLLVLQFWRNLGPEKMDLPLAFCDARTTPAGRVQGFPVANYAGSGIDFDAMGVMAPTDDDPQRWYGFDRMTRDEVVTFRTYDTDRIGTGEPYWTPHSAYRDPEVELGRPARSGIELRATCLFL